MSRTERSVKAKRCSIDRVETNNWLAFDFRGQTKSCVLEPAPAELPSAGCLQRPPSSHALILLVVYPEDIFRWGSERGGCHGKQSKGGTNGCSDDEARNDPISWTESITDAQLFVNSSSTWNTPLKQLNNPALRDVAC